MKEITTYVGIDAHKKDLFVAMLIGTSATPVTWTVANEPNAVRRLVRKLEPEAPGPVQACYEAGPCGYALQRQMTTRRVSCQVIAPAAARFGGRICALLELAVPCLLPVLASVRTKWCRRLVRAGWARCIAPAIRSLDAK